MERKDWRRADALDRYWDGVIDGGSPDRPTEVDDVMAAVIAHLAVAPADETARERTRLRILAQTQIMEASMIARHHTNPVLVPAGPGALPRPPRARPRWPTHLATAALLVITMVMGLVTFGRRSAGPETPLSHLIAPSAQPLVAATPEASPQPQSALAEFVAEIPLGTGPISSPEGVAVGTDGTLYVIDSFQEQILLFDGDGQPIGAWGEAGTGPGQFWFHDGGAGFGDLAIGPDGNIYITDSFNNRIQVLGPDGAFLRQWGDMGPEEGNFSEPGGIAIDAAGRVYVADTDNGRVQVFDPEGQFLAAWAPSEGEGGSRPSPNDVTVDQTGIVSVSDGTTKQVIRFAADGAAIGSFGGAGAEPDHLADPAGLVSDDQGNLFVADEMGNSIQVFSPDGTLLGTIGAAGIAQGQFISPVDLAIGPDGLLYVSDGGNRRIQVFRLRPLADTGQEIIAETLIDVADVALPPSHAQVYTTITELQPGVSADLDDMMGSLAYLIEQGTVRITHGDTERVLQAGERWAAPLDSEFTFENVGNDMVRIVEAGAVDSTALTSVDANFESAFSDPLGGTENFVISDATTFAGGTGRMTLERLTLPPGAVLAPHAQPTFRWVGLVTGRLGVTLEGERLPFRWDSGEERTYGVAQSLPVIAPGTEVTLRNAEDVPMVLYLLTIEPSGAEGSPGATPAP